MPYRFAVERQDYSDYASGRVFCSLPGRPALPVRLTSEIFQRCLALRPAAPLRVYDPLCGGAYSLAILAYLHWPHIGELIGSDIDDEALHLARRNLDLLTPEGLQQRRAELAAMAMAYGRDSYRIALEALGRLEQQLHRCLREHRLQTRLFRADALDPGALLRNLGPASVDLVLTDLPYGRQVQWQGVEGGDSAERLLEALRQVLAPGGLAALASDKQQRIGHEGYRRLERFTLGKRQVAILAPIPVR